MADILFVDADDNPIGSGTKKEATENGIIHRIVRIFITNSRGEILLQKRAGSLRVAAGKWDQSVGGHVDAGEGYDEAAYREMQEELGITGIPLTRVLKYYVEGEDPPHRKRFNMIYTGVYDGEVIANPEEISEVKWVSPAQLEELFKTGPEDFTQGCINAWGRLKSEMQTNPEIE